MAHRRMTQVLLWWIRFHGALAKHQKGQSSMADEAKDAVDDMMEEAQDFLTDYSDQWIELMERSRAVFERHEASDGGPPPPAVDPGPPAVDPGPPAPEGEIVFISQSLGDCAVCGQPIGRTAVGWRSGAGPGPVCITCLAGSSPDLAAALGMFGFLRNSARQDFPDEQDVFETGAAVLAMAQRYAAASSWPVRPTGGLEVLEVAHEILQERHGPFWLSELVRQAGDDEEPS